MDVPQNTESVRVLEKSTFDDEVLFRHPFGSHEEAEAFVRRQDSHDTVFEIEGDD